MGGALTNKRNYLAWLLAAVVAASFTWFQTIGYLGAPMQRQVTISAGTPFSFDPIDYDAFTHHFTQRPVLATLVSNYRSGDIIGVLAKGWTVSDDGRQWTFEIRHGLQFSDGLPITPSQIKSSLTRAAALMKQRGSKSGLFEKMAGFDSLIGPSSAFEGIVADDSQNLLHFRFSESPSGMLDKLSFGLYAVAHPKDWDPKTGQWLNPKSALSSGPYVVESWGNEDLSLKLRQDFPLKDVYGNDRPFDSVTFVISTSGRTATQPMDWGRIDLVSGLKGEQVSPAHEFRGEAQNGILFLRIMGQDNPKSPFHDKSVRESLRAFFHSTLSNAGLTTTSSFLPLAIAGTREVSDTSISVATSESVTQLIGEKEPATVRICDYKAQSGLRRTALDALVSSLQQVGLKTEVVSVPPPELAKGFDGSAQTVACDAALILTSVLLATPWDDLRFMVHSREGIRLPDPTGQLASAVDQDPIDPQNFNEAVWNDALVWPILHATAGLWVNPKRVNTSLLDLIHPPTEVALLRSVE